MRRRTVYLLGAASFVNDTSSEAIYSLLPFYVENPALVGFFGGLFNGLGSVLKVFFGYLADRLGKPLLLVRVGYALSAFAKTLMAVLPIPFLPLAIVLDRFGKGIRDSPRDAILAFLARRGWAFGVHRAMDTAGALFGVFLAFVLLNYAGIREALLLAGLLAFLSLVPLNLLPSIKVAPRSRGFWSALQSLSPHAKRLLLSATLFGFAFFTPMLLVQLAKPFYGSNAIMLYALFNVCFIVSSLYLGKRSDVLGRRNVIILGAALASTAILSLYLSTKSPLLFPLAFLLYGLGFGAFQPAMFAYVGDVARQKGTAMGAFQSVYGFSVLLSSTLLGLGISLFGPSVLLLFAFLPPLGALSLRYV